MADKENTAMEVDKGENKPSVQQVPPQFKNSPQIACSREQSSGRSGSRAEYCEQLQAWMWQYYAASASWQSWLAAAAVSYPCYLQPSSLSFTAVDLHSHSWYNNGALGLPLSPYPPSAVSSSGSRAGAAAGGAAAPPPREEGHAHRHGREYNIPSPFQRLMAEMVDFFILFFIKATIIISIIHLSGIKDVSKFAMHFIVEEIDEDTSMEELQKMMLVALVYRILVCFYEIICIWGAGGATPGKFLIGLRVVTCDSSVLVHPNRVLVMPATNVSLSASTVRALNKNFSIAFFFPAFITLLFFQHNRTVYDMVAGTIVVKRSRAR
ncbi:protein FAM8A1-like [Cololabis saira]|uniref:protein FAM8A1-like n=1 Tax=Cololabis saira TaxID=129043 RepID=UPI002AD31523|nr:protein FAM8A1-like [Cololabis saira]